MFPNILTEAVDKNIIQVKQAIHWVMSKDLDLLAGIVGLILAVLGAI